MYKVKDDIDLKELENFGFKKDYSGNGYTRLLDENDNLKKLCFVYCSSVCNLLYSTIPKILYICTPMSIEVINDNLEYLIKDLIDNNIIEKVSD